MTDVVFIDLCGRLADTDGPCLTMPLEHPMTIAAVVKKLSEAFPALAVAIAERPVRFAINERLAEPAALVEPGQRLALLPPVSGG